MLEIFEGVIFCLSLYCAYVGCKEDYEDSKNDARNDVVKNSKAQEDIYDPDGDEPVSILPELPSYSDVCKM